MYQLAQYILARYTIQLVYNGLRLKEVLHYEQEHVKLAETY